MLLWEQSLLDGNFTIEVLRYPYVRFRGLDSMHAANHFGEILSTRLREYSEAWSKPVIPMGSVDAIADHLSIRDSKSGRLIASVKLVPYERCNTHGIVFPPIDVLKEGLPDLLPAFETWRAQSLGEITYVGSWFVVRELQKSRQASDFISRACIGAAFSHFMEEKYENQISFAVSRFGIEKLHKKWGWEPLSNNNNFREPFTSQMYQNEVLTTSVGKLSQITPAVTECISLIETHWKNRTIIQEDLSTALSVA